MLTLAFLSANVTTNVEASGVVNKHVWCALSHSDTKDEHCLCSQMAGIAVATGSCRCLTTADPAPRFNGAIGKLLWGRPWLAAVDFTLSLAFYTLHRGTHSGGCALSVPPKAGLPNRQLLPPSLDLTNAAYRMTMVKGGILWVTSLSCELPLSLFLCRLSLPRAFRTHICAPGLCPPNVTLSPAATLPKMCCMDFLSFTFRGFPPFLFFLIVLSAQFRCQTWANFVEDTFFTC
ncbi:hypothetical protein Ddc_12056 [Ditylenchus destructor]|nr:hypothetical protein Ddc_12056 [Ditylenchus destructor]